MLRFTSLKTPILLVTLLFSVGAVAIAYPSAPSDPDVLTTLGYLRGEQGPDGSIGGFGTSTWVVSGIVAAGENPSDWKAGNDSIVDYLTGHAETMLDVNSPTEVERFILAMVAAGKNPRNINKTDYVSVLKGHYIGGRMGGDSFLNDDFWGVIALASAGEGESPIVSDLIEYILLNQNDDGGWGYAEGVSSDTDDTAAALMALRAGGVHADNQSIVEGLNYLKSQQLSNGGFDSWGFGSNADTDAWAILAIVAAGEDPTSIEWTVDGKTPLDDLARFRCPDGSYNWTVVDEGMDKIKTTASVLNALLGVPYPVATTQGVGVEVRIEGPSSTLWRGDVYVNDTLVVDDLGGEHYLDAPTALGALAEASREGGFPYTVHDYGWGLLVTHVDGDPGIIGWMYRVDYASPQVGAGAFILNQTSPPDPPHQKVLWYAPQGWSDRPLGIAVDKTEVAAGEAFTVTTTYFNGSEWHPLEGATVHADQNYLSGPDGTVQISISDEATYSIYAEKDGYIRSERVEVKVLGATSQVDVTAEIIPEVSIIVSPSSIDFGPLGPGETSSPHDISVTNMGSSDSVVTVEVVDDSGLFVEGILIDDDSWRNLNVTLKGYEGVKTLIVKLQVPEDYGAMGEVTGTLIFWAEKT